MVISQILPLYMYRLESNHIHKVALEIELREGLPKTAQSDALFLFPVQHPFRLPFKYLNIMPLIWK